MREREGSGIVLRDEGGSRVEDADNATEDSSQMEKEIGTNELKQEDGKEDLEPILPRTSVSLTLPFSKKYVLHLRREVQPPLRIPYPRVLRYQSKLMIHGTEDPDVLIVSEVTPCKHEDYEATVACTLILSVRGGGRGGEGDGPVISRPT